MAIKSEITKVDPPQKKTIFPRLMVGNYTGVVVLMTEPSKGSVVGHTGLGHTEAFPIGYESTGWSEASFSDFAGAVTLSNEEAA